MGRQKRDTGWVSGTSLVPRGGAGPLPFPACPEGEEVYNFSNAVDTIPAQHPDNADDRIHLRRPVTVQDLALALGMKSHHVLAELMWQNLFYNLKETIPDSVAQDLAQRHHRILVIDG
jgi:hypothetical protein